MRRGAWSLCVIAVLVTSGCASDQAPQTASFSSVGELSAAYLDAGGECADLTEQFRASESDPAVVTCGEGTQLTLATSTAQAAQVGVSYRLRDEPVLLGGTWLIQDPDIATIQDALGGEIITLDPAAGPANLADAIVVNEQGVLAQDPVPADGLPAQAEYDNVITVVVDPQCEYCQIFMETNGDALTELAAAGTATIAYLPVAINDAPSNNFASSMGVNAIACAADAEPDAAVDVLTAVLAGQDANGWTPAELAALGDDAGVDIASCTEAGTFAYWTRHATLRALNDPLADGFPLGGVPTVLIGSELYSGDVADADAFNAAVAAQFG